MKHKTYLHIVKGGFNVMQGIELPAARQNNTVMMLTSQGNETINRADTTQTIATEDIIGEDALYDSFQKCIRNVRWKPSVGRLTHHYISELSKLSSDLYDKTYKPHKAKLFRITEPKPRDIMSMHIRDRIYLRSLNDNAIYPQITKSLIPDNFACQKGKGTDPARIRLKEFLYEYYRKNKCQGYRLQIDIHGYYPNMDRSYAKAVFRKRIESNLYPMAAEVLDYHPGDVGFNPGDQTIQNVGIAALDDLDHYVKERLRIRYYIRYMDDFIIIHPDKEYLGHCLEKIKAILNRQNMELNPKKTEIKHIKEPFLFLGFSYRLTETGKVVIFADPAKIKHERKKLRRMANHVISGQPVIRKKKIIYLTKHDVDCHFKSYKSCIRFGNSRRLIYNLNRYYDSLWKGYKNERILHD